MPAEERGRMLNCRAGALRIAGGPGRGGVTGGNGIAEGRVLGWGGGAGVAVAGGGGGVTTGGTCGGGTKGGTIVGLVNGGAPGWLAGGGPGPAGGATGWVGVPGRVGVGS